MRRARIACEAVLLVVLGLGCDGGGDPATSPINPFGDEAPGASGVDPTAPPAGANESIMTLCERACTNLAGACPTTAGDPVTCAADCTATDTRGCSDQFHTFVACLASSRLTCDATGMVTAPGCESDQSQVVTCIEAMGGGTSGGTSGGGT
jgi:hypothetical protein